MSLADFTKAAILRLEDLHVAGSRVSGEPIYNTLSPRVRSEAILGDGPSAGVEPGKTVSMSGFPGRTHISDISKLLKGFDVTKITAVPM